ncbi:unnamed protein product [Calypogeia fissa]
MASGHSRSSSCDSSTASSRCAGYIEHPVSRFDTWAGVAIKYGVEVGDIKRMNGLVTDLQMFEDFKNSASGKTFANFFPQQCRAERHPGAGKGKAAASFEPFPRPSRWTVQKVVGCTSIAMEDELAAEMAALGLPSSFIAGLGHSPSTATKSRRKKPSSSSSQSRTGTDDKHAESLGATDGNVPSSNFRIRSIRHERRSEVDVRGGREESCVVDSVDVRWEPVWDEQYQCYYFCNIKTWESTCDPPPGFENYAAITSLAADQQTGSLFGTQERTLGHVCDEGITSKEERYSGSSVGAIPGLVEQSKDEEGRLSTVKKLEAMANYGCEDERNDLIVKGSSKEEIQLLLGITNSHIRFGESDESISRSTGEGQDSGIDWTEISEEMPIQFRKQNDDEEGKDGCEACSGSSRHLVSSFQLKARQRIKASETGTKKRRVRSLSGLC